MRQICTVEVCVLAKELEKELVGYKIDKFYETGKGRFRFRLSKERTKKELVCVLCKRINTTDTVETAEKPTNFALAMRKRICFFGIESISQLNNDRIISIKLSKGEERVEIIIEMFGKGNILVADDSGVIKLAYTNHRFKDRVVFPKEKYVVPKNEGLNISMLEAARTAVREAIKKDGSKTVAKGLTGAANIGSIYIENAIRQAGVDPKRQMESLNSDEMERIADQISGIEDTIENPLPIVYTDEKKPVEYAVSKLVKRNEEEKSFRTLGEALDFYSKNEAEEDDEGIDNPKAKELEISMGRQRETLERMGEEIEQNKKAGELIFNNMHIINEMIETAQKDRHITKEELQRLFPNIRIIDVDLKKKRIRFSMVEG